MTFAANAKSYRQNYNYGYDSETSKRVGLIQLGYGHGVSGSGQVIGNYEANRFNFSSVLGYKFSPYFVGGFGVGMNYYNTPYCKDLTMPVFLYLHSNFSQGNTSPFISLGGGFNRFLANFDNIQIDKGGYFGGLTVEPTFGLSFKISQKFRLSLSLSYTLDQVQYLKQLYLASYLISSEKVTGYAGALTFKIGILNF